MEEETLPLFIRKRKRLRDRQSQIPISPDKVRPRKKQKPHPGIVTKTGKAGRMQQMEKTKEINRLNKQRARSMENRIAKVFGGVRVPLSGALKMWKGDVLVPIVDENNDQMGHFIIECKLSAQSDTSGTPSVRFFFKWFDQLENEVFITRAKFGIVVFYFHNTSHYYAAITPANFRVLLKYPLKHAILNHMLDAPVQENWSQRSDNARLNNKHQYQFQVNTDYLQKNMQHAIIDETRISWMKVSMYSHEKKKAFDAIIMPLAVFKELIIDIT